MEPLTLDASSVLSRVGFGCSNLLGDKTREQGLRLLETAYEHGVRRFDVARVYNFGDAEAMLGEFLAGKRDQIVLSTKFGLMPREGVAKLQGPVQIARRLMRSSTWIRKLVRRNVKKLTQAGRFDVATAQQSLDASLRALRTDFLDVYLMHECTAADCTDDIYEFLQQALVQGKIRAHGCGTAFGRMTAIAAEHPRFLPVAQFESSLLQPHVAEFQALQSGTTQTVTTHGALAAAPALRERLTQSQGLRESLNQRLGIDLEAGATLYGFLLSWALQENSHGTVLFRAGSPERIQSTLRSLEQVHVSAGDLEGILAEVNASI